MSYLMKLIGDYAEQRVASSLLVQDRDADAADSFAIEDRLVREITDAHADEIRRAKEAAWDEGWEAAVEQAPGDVWFDEWHYQTNPHGEAVS